ncbi:MAG: hypothetical protein MUE60_16225 [Candidatus Eisenbacteria bacterium]|nr:hypothetical protein [Candidatus Eisenbacteria bacterium]
MLKARTISCLLAIALVWWVLPPEAAACVVIRQPGRLVFHGAAGVYLAKAQSSDSFEVLRTLVGPSASFIAAPAIEKEALSECTLQVLPFQDEEYVVIGYCTPVRIGPGRLLFPCDASAWLAEESPDYLAYLEHRRRFGREELARQLRNWRDGGVDLKAMADWLTTTAEVADFTDWSTPTYRDGESITSQILNMSIALFEALARCPESTAEVQLSFRRECLPGVLALLASSIKDPDDPAAEAVLDRVDKALSAAFNLADSCMPRDNPSPVPGHAAPPSPPAASPTPARLSP